jgi:hypothetical protein
LLVSALTPLAACGVGNWPIRLMSALILGCSSMISGLLARRLSLVAVVLPLDRERDVAR